PAAASAPRPRPQPPTAPAPPPSRPPRRHPYPVGVVAGRLAVGVRDDGDVGEPRPLDQGPQLARRVAPLGVALDERALWRAAVGLDVGQPGRLVVGVAPGVVDVVGPTLDLAARPQ